MEMKLPLWYFPLFWCNLKYGEICTIVLLFMFNFLSAFFLTLFKVAGMFFLAGRDIFVKYFPEFSVRLVRGESFLN